MSYQFIHQWNQCKWANEDDSYVNLITPLPAHTQ